MVTLGDAQYAELQKKKILGENDSERLRNAFIVYLNTEQMLKVLEIVTSKRYALYVILCKCLIWVDFGSLFADFCKKHEKKTLYRGNR